MQSNKTWHSSLFFCLFNYTTREKDTTMQSSFYGLKPCNLTKPGILLSFSPFSIIQLERKIQLYNLALFPVTRKSVG